MQYKVLLVIKNQQFARIQYIYIINIQYSLLHVSAVSRHLQTAKLASLDFKSRWRSVTEAFRRECDVFLTCILYVHIIGFQ
jgi:hypothetical protein